MRSPSLQQLNEFCNAIFAQPPNRRLPATRPALAGERVQLSFVIYLIKESGNTIRIARLPVEPRGRRTLRHEYYTRTNVPSQDVAGKKRAYLIGNLTLT